MFQPPRRAAWLLLATAMCSQHSAHAYYLPLLRDAVLWERASSTCDSGFSPCTNTGLPSNFCCPTDSVCDALAGNTTVVCCPLGKDCAQISPITCDIQKQNVDLFPDATIKTTALNGNLVKCGTNTCCPFGYSCSSNQDTCVRNANQNAAPLQNVPTSSTTTAKSTSTSTSASKSTTSTSTSTSTSISISTSTTSSHTSTSTQTSSSFQTSLTTTAKTTPGPTTASTEVPLTVIPETATATVASSTASQTSATSAAGAQTSTAAANAQSPDPSAASPPSNGTSKASIAGGVIGGLAGVALVGAALWFFCVRRRRGGSTPGMGTFSKSQPGTSKSSNSMTSFGNIINNPLNITISSPKPQDDKQLYRADFIRKAPASRDGALPPIPAEDAMMSGAAGGGGVGADNGRAVYNVSPLSASEAGSGLRLSPRPLILRRSQQQQQQPEDDFTPRESAMEMEINVGVDPRMFLDGGSFTVSPTATSPTTYPPNMMRPVADPRYMNSMSTTMAPPPRPRRSQDRLTTFSGLMREANLDPQQPYVPQPTPDPRRR